MGANASQQKPGGPIGFHELHGRNITLDPSRHIATRRGNDDGICILNRPVARGEHVTLRILGMNPGAAAETILIGFTKVDPNKFSVDQLPRTTIPDLLKVKGFWAKFIPKESGISEGSTVEYWTNDVGDVLYSIDGVEKGKLMSNKVITKKNIYPFLELYGAVTSIQVGDAIKPPAPTFQPEKLLLEQLPGLGALTDEALLAELDKLKLLEAEPDPFAQFQNAGTHVALMSLLEIRTFRDLIWGLVFSRDNLDDMEKVRTIFLWMCTRQLAQLNFVGAAPGTNEDTLLQWMHGTGKVPTAQVFKMFCDYSGVPCLVVQGYAKGFGYRPDLQVASQQFRHTWNLVYVNRAWRPMDVLWAGKRLQGETINDEQVVRDKIDIFYFLPNPSQFIYTHCPDKPEWQLLQNPITFEAFEQLAIVKGSFFGKYALEFVTHRTAVIQCDPNEQELEIVFLFPPFLREKMLFTYSMTFADTGEDKKAGTRLSEWGMHEQAGNQAIFRVRVPDARPLRLTIYAKKMSALTALIPGQQVFENVCEYRIMPAPSRSGMLPMMPTFPPCSTGSYGPTELYYKYLIGAAQPAAAIQAVNGISELSFTLPKALRIRAKLRTQLEPDDKNLARYVFARVADIGGHSEGRVTVYFPLMGEYSLEVYVNDPETDGNTMYLIWTYLVQTETGADAVTTGILPTISSGFLGAQPSSKESGVVNLNFTDPFIRIFTSTKTLSFAFAYDQPIRSLAKLIHCVKGGEEVEISNFTLLQVFANEKKAEYQIRLPYFGYYKFQIYASTNFDTNTPMPGIFNYLIESVSLNPDLQEIIPIPFPKQYANWKLGCRLIEPLDCRLADQVLATGQPTKFQLIAPLPIKVALIVGDEWFPLEQRDGAWVGELDLKKFAGRADLTSLKVTVAGKYEEKSSTYYSMLEYSLA